MNQFCLTNNCNPMKIALIPLNPVVGQVAKNGHKIIQNVEKAIADNCQMVVFPEMAITGYPLKDLIYFKELHQAQSSVLNKLKTLSKKIAIVVGGVSTRRATGRRFHNTAFFINNGHVQTYHKHLLPNYDVFDECRYFEPGNEVLIVKLGRHKIAITICEDLWTTDSKLKTLYHDSVLDQLKTSKITAIINISASPFELDKWERRQQIVQKAAEHMKVPVLYINQLGANDDLIFDGGAIVSNAKGKTILDTPRFHPDPAYIDLNEISNQAPVQNQHQPLELLKQALITGVHDYVTKSGFSQVVLGLSGGVDSALVAYLAAEALGSQNVLGVLMPSRYSSKGSVDDALALAKNLKITTQTCPIKEPHSAFENTLTPLFKDGLKDLTAQNIQARIRGDLLMAISNNTGRLLLNTTNKSEMALGFGTLYGDMCGALAVLADVPKTWVYDLCEHINQNAEVIPKAILDKPPSAELKPDQKDTDSLPPYNEIDEIIDSFIDRHLIDTTTGESDFEIIRKIHLNEYKRFQAPPGLKVMAKAFGSGRRIPIVSEIDFEKK